MKIIGESEVRLVLVPFLRFLVEKDKQARHNHNFIFKNAIKKYSDDELEALREAIAKSVYKSFLSPELIVVECGVELKSDDVGHTDRSKVDHLLNLLEVSEKKNAHLEQELVEHKDYINKLSVESQKLNRENEDLRQEILALKAQKKAADSSGSGGKAQPAVDPLGVFNP